MCCRCSEPLAVRTRVRPSHGAASFDAFVPSSSGPSAVSPAWFHRATVLLVRLSCLSAPFSDSLQLCVAPPGRIACRRGAYCGDGVLESALHVVLVLGFYRGHTLGAGRWNLLCLCAALRRGKRPRCHGVHVAPHAALHAAGRVAPAPLLLAASPPRSYCQLPSLARGA